MSTDAHHLLLHAQFTAILRGVANMLKDLRHVAGTPFLPFWLNRESQTEIATRNATLEHVTTYRHSMVSIAYIVDEA